MNQELINKALSRVQNSDINLGTANGWSQETSDIYSELKKYTIPESSTSENLGRCYNRYTFDVELSGNRYTVVYAVDSSD